MAGVEAGADPGHLDRYVGGNPMGGSERSGPEHASASVLDGVVWVLSPAPVVPEATVARLAAWVDRSELARCRWIPNATTGWWRW